jgi:hypothetical protein
LREEKISRIDTYLSDVPMANVFFALPAHNQLWAASAGLDRDTVYALTFFSTVGAQTTAGTFCYAKQD